MEKGVPKPGSNPASVPIPPPRGTRGGAIQPPLFPAPRRRYVGQNNEVSAPGCFPHGCLGMGAQFSPEHATNSRVSTRLGHA